jgi:hypothetical protein
MRKQNRIKEKKKDAICPRTHRHGINPFCPLFDLQLNPSSPYAQLCSAPFVSLCPEKQNRKIEEKLGTGRTEMKKSRKQNLQKR